MWRLQREKQGLNHLGWWFQVLRRKQIYTEHASVLYRTSQKRKIRSRWQAQTYLRRFFHVTLDTAKKQHFQNNNMHKSRSISLQENNCSSQSLFKNNYTLALSSDHFHNASELFLLRPGLGQFKTV